MSEFIYSMQLNEVVYIKSFLLKEYFSKKVDHNLDFKGTSQLFNVIPPFVDFE